jgi:hypothetical protein
MNTYPAPVCDNLKAGVAAVAEERNARLMCRPRDFSHAINRPALMPCRRRCPTGANDATLDKSGHNATLRPGVHMRAATRGRIDRNALILFTILLPY